MGKSLRRDLLQAVTHFLTSMKNLFPAATRDSAISIKGEQFRINHFLSSRGTFTGYGAFFNIAAMVLHSLVGRQPVRGKKKITIEGTHY